MIDRRFVPCLPCRHESCRRACDSLGDCGFAFSFGDSRPNDGAVRPGGCPHRVDAAGGELRSGGTPGTLGRDSPAGRSPLESHGRARHGRAVRGCRGPARAVRGTAARLAGLQARRRRGRVPRFSMVPRRDGLWAGVGRHQIAVQRLERHAAGNPGASLCGILATGSAEAITTLGVRGRANRNSELVAFARAMAPPDADAFGAVHLGELVELFARRGNTAGRALLGGLALRMRLAGWVKDGPAPGSRRRGRHGDADRRGGRALADRTGVRTVQDRQRRDVHNHGEARERRACASDRLRTGAFMADPRRNTRIERRRGADGRSAPG